MTPVVILSDASIASCSAPWRIPELDSIEPIKALQNPHALPYQPYERSEQYLSRAWVKPGDAGLIHQLGGLEKDSLSGKISYDAENHQKMVDLRAQKISRVKNFVPPPVLFGPATGELLLVGFGGSFGALREASIQLNNGGSRVAHLQLSLLNPLHEEIGPMLHAFSQVLVVEHNSGQLQMLLRAKFLIDAKGLNKMTGKPFLVDEVIEYARQLINVSQVIS